MYHLFPDTQAYNIIIDFLNTIHKTTYPKGERKFCWGSPIMQTAIGNLIQNKSSHVFSLSPVVHFISQDIGNVITGCAALDLSHIKTLEKA